MNDLDLVRLVGDTPPGAGAASEWRARKRLRELIESDLLLSGRSHTPRSTWKARKALLPVAAALVAALAILVLFPRNRSASASELLRTAASVAGAQAWAGPMPGQYVYVRTEQTVREGAGDGTLTTQVREQWVAPDGSGRIIDRTGDTRYGQDELFFVDPSTLPTEPSLLEAHLRESDELGAATSDIDLFEKIAVYLGGTNAPPEVRSALFEVASDIPGIDLVDPTTDSAGRPGIGVLLQNESIRVELVFDPQDSRLLSWSETSISDEGDRLLHEVAYVEVDVVDSVDDRPGDGA
jgi:hypothetical protein